MRRPSDLAKETGHFRSRSLGGARPATDAFRPEWPLGFATSQADREALLVLLSLASLTARRLLGLAGERGTAAACLAAVKAGEAASLADGIRSKAIEAPAIAEALRQAGGRFVPVHDPEYPPALLDLTDPPAGVFVRGHDLRELEPRVSIVGARNCSPSGRDFAVVLGRGLALAGVCVVSGGARGIDSHAHEGALDRGGPTVAVLGCGLDVAYPPQNGDLLTRIADAGALVTEYPPGTRPSPSGSPRATGWLRPCRERWSSWRGRLEAGP